MFDLEPVEIEGERRWFVAADSPGFKAAVIVPADQCQGMTDEEIGRAVRELMPQAHLLDAQVWARIILGSGGEQFGGDAELRLLKEFKGQDENVAAAYYKLLERRRAALSRAGRKHDEGMKKRVGRYFTAVHHRVGERDGYRCAECGRSEINVAEDEISFHLTYINEQSATGDPANAANMQLLCTTCIQRRGINQ